MNSRQDAGGGNGQTTFALPDPRGRVPVGAGANAAPLLGEKGETAEAATGTGATTKTPTLALNDIIAVEGIYPSRSD